MSKKIMGGSDLVAIAQNVVAMALRDADTVDMERVPFLLIEEPKLGVAFAEHMGKHHPGLKYATHTLTPNQRANKRQVIDMLERCEEQAIKHWMAGHTMNVLGHDPDDLAVMRSYLEARYPAMAMRFAIITPDQLRGIINAVSDTERDTLTDALFAKETP